MRLDELCVLELRYTTDFHYVSPYEGQSGKGWGLGEGTAAGDRLNGTLVWSNHPTGRGDGAMQPAARGVITTSEDASVMFDFSGRTVFVERDGRTTGRQLLMTLFESEHESYRWLNDTVCMTEGAVDPERMVMRARVYVCVPELT
jgi:hypothetical protein